VRIHCTYCSASKNKSAGLLPAIERYTSPRIARVGGLARQEGVPFWILSGEYGLIPQSYPIRWYDHRLVEAEVLALARRVVEQLKEGGISQVVYFEPLAADGAGAKPYREVMETACVPASVTLEVRMIGSTPSRWRCITDRAIKARELMMRDREQGEAEFERLLSRYGEDGMILYQRGRAYESLHSYERAHHDYAQAERLFPMQEWKDRARTARERVAKILEERHAQENWLDSAFTALGTWCSELGDLPDSLRQEVDLALRDALEAPQQAAVALRRCLEGLLDLDAPERGRVSQSNEDLSTRVRALDAPDAIVSHMHCVRIMGNIGAHPGELTSKDLLCGCVAMLNALEWWTGHRYK
jgi:tetratricopeptide (TPR) repeat protein